MNNKTTPFSISSDIEGINQRLQDDSILEEDGKFSGSFFAVAEHFPGHDNCQLAPNKSTMTT